MQSRSLTHTISINPKIANFRLLQCLHLDPEETRSFKIFFLLRTLCNTLLNIGNAEAAVFIYFGLFATLMGFVGHHVVKYSLTVSDIYEP